MLQSEAIQELRKTSDALTALQVEATELRKQADSLRTENVTFSQKFDVQKCTLYMFSIFETDCYPGFFVSIIPCLVDVDCCVLLCLFECSDSFYNNGMRLALSHPIEVVTEIFVGMPNL